MVIIVTLMVAGILRLVDVRKELGALEGSFMHFGPTVPDPGTFYGLRRPFFTLFVLFLYGPMNGHLTSLSFQGPQGRHEPSR